MTKRGWRNTRAGSKRGNMNPLKLLALNKKRFRKKLKRKEKKSTVNNFTKTIPKSKILDALLPGRKKKWLPVDGWKRSKKRDVILDVFSFIDSPEQTLSSLRAIALADCRNLETRIHFRDLYCLDMGPYLTLALMAPELASNNISGGTISGPVKKVLASTGLSKHLGMETNKSDTNSSDIYSMKILKCHPNPQQDSPIRVASQSQTATELFKTMNGWLNQVGYEFNDMGKDQILKMAGEVLDNAVTHSNPDTFDGEAWVSAFMARRKVDGKKFEHICHITVLSIGASISESLDKTCDDNTRFKINRLIQRHKKFFRIRHRKWTKQCLWTLYALQDGVSRLTSETPGGKGLMDLIGFCSRLGKTDNFALRPKMAIISGNTCIKFGGQKPQGIVGQRRLALNSENDLNNPPDNDYIWSMNKSFPGTILTMRFHLNPEFLDKI